MKKRICTILLIFFILSSSCQNKGFLIDNNNNNFEKYKANFDKTLINHFPDEIIYPNVNIVSNTNRKKNDIGLLLYEYDVNDKEINKIRNKFSNAALAIYESKDSCFLIVNRFETDDSYTNFHNVAIQDSLDVDKECARELYPIPNFISSNYSKNRGGLKLDDSFKIYVLEAKTGSHFKQFELPPSSQMPKKWANGYSKGIAISEKNRAIIYWSIIW